MKIGRGRIESCLDSQRLTASQLREEVRFQQNFSCSALELCELFFGRQHSRVLKSRACDARDCMSSPHRLQFVAGDAKRNRRLTFRMCIFYLSLKVSC